MLPEQVHDSLGASIDQDPLKAQCFPENNFNYTFPIDCNIL